MSPSVQPGTTGNDPCGLIITDCFLGHGCPLTARHFVTWTLHSPLAEHVLPGHTQSIRVPEARLCRPGPRLAQDFLHLCLSRGSTQKVPRWPCLTWTLHTVRVPLEALLSPPAQRDSPRAGMPVSPAIETRTSRVVAEQSPRAAHVT